VHASCYIAGEWIDTSAQFPVYDPATGKQVGTSADAGPREVDLAIGAADAAFADWSGRTGLERGALLRKLSAELLDAVESIADVIVAEQGKPRAQAAFEVRMATQWLDWYAEEARRTYGEIVPPSIAGKQLMVLRQPVGVVLAITPWNFPLYMIVRKLAPGLAAGCTMVVKPAEQTPLAASELFSAIDRAGFPPGVANLVTASDPEAVAPALLSDERVRKISFTGSTEVGKILVRASAERLTRVSLELGGHAPFIVFDDADLDAAVAGLLAAKFQVCGQSCICPNRVFVQEGVVGDFQERLVAAVRALKVGHGTDPLVNIGPLIDERGLDKVQRHVADAQASGATVLVGGARLEGEAYDLGSFYPPTVLTDVTDGMTIAREETFGPVVPLLSFTDVEEVIRRANDSDYGLAAYLYTKDLGRALRVSSALEYGIVGVNDPTPATATAPFGGFKQSGIGREGGHQGIDAFLETKLVSIVS
jgi:succinate-semialdehyde dehydrogenase/glutarate-semialdehyde dehydrogenase